MTRKRKIWGCTLGNCVHVAGIYRFLHLAEECGYQTVWGGVGLSVDQILEGIGQERPDYVGLSYRLTPAVAATILTELQTKTAHRKFPGTQWLFGGTPPVCREAQKTGLFQKIFGTSAESEAEVLRWLNGQDQTIAGLQWADTLLGRIANQAPYPLLRHHFGLPNLEATIEGVNTIANSKTVDIISIGPDQNAQQFFFRQQEMVKSQDGAGGVPLRRAADLRAIYRAAQTGNFPLLRIYSGTQDLIAWAELSVKELHNAWAAIPLFWYSVLDGRSGRTLNAAIAENQQAMAWYGRKNLPVEVNDAHHWSLRDAPAEVAVAAAYLAACNAKQHGVKDFILQMMWNTPVRTTPTEDLAKMLAKLELLQPLADANFRIWREVRAGLASLSPQPNIAKGELAASTALALQVEPHIVHVVGFCEGDHAATPEDIVESCQIVQGVLHRAFRDMPDMKEARAVQLRKETIVKGALRIIETIGGLSADNPLTNPDVLAAAVRQKILYAPQIMIDL